MKREIMKQPGLLIKTTLPIVICFILAGSQSLLPVLKLGSHAVAADDPNQAPFVVKKAAGLKQAADLSKTSLAWRQKLSKHVFTNIDRELQSLEQQFLLHNSAKGKRFIKRVKVSLQKMKYGKQKFLSTGREPFLASFYNGRTVLEYNLWKLKNLSRDLEMDPDQSQALYRVYALMNKWLVYVAHREINARRQGAAPPQTAAPSNQDVGEPSAELQPISEIATITEADMEEADKAISLAPSLVQEMTSNTGHDTPDAPSFSEEDIDFTETTPLSNWVFVLIMGIGVLLVLFLLFRSKIKIFQMKDPFTKNIYDNGDSENELINIDDFVTSENIDYGIPWEDDSTHEYVARQIEAWTQENEEPATEGKSIESAPTQVTDNGFGDDNQEDMAFQEEVAQVQENTLINETLDASNEIKENMGNKVETLHDEEKESSRVSINLLKQNHSPDEAQEVPDKEEELTRDFANVLAEKDSLTNKLETLNTEKGELSQKLEHIHTEINSLTETLEASNREKENLEKQLESLTVEKEDLAQKQDHLRTENDSLTQKLKTLNTEQEEFSQGMEQICAENDSLTKKLETLHSEKEEFAKELENTRAENNSLTESLEASNREKENLETQLKSFTDEKEEAARKQDHLHSENDSLTKKLDALHSEKEELAQELENTRTKNNFLTKSLEGSNRGKEDLEIRLKAFTDKKEEAARKQDHLHVENESLTRKLDTLHSEKEEFAQELKNTRTENNSLTEALEASNKEKEDLEKQLKKLRSREKQLGKKLESTLAENHSRSESSETSNNEIEELKKQLEDLCTEKEKLKRERKKTVTENNSLTKELESAHRENKNLIGKQKSSDAKLKAAKKKNKELLLIQENAPDEQDDLTKKLKAAQKKIKELEKALKNTSIEQEDSTKKLKTAQDKIKKITEKNKELTNQCKLLQTENSQPNGPDHEFIAELLAMSDEVKDLKKKLESAFSKTVKKSRDTSSGSLKNNQKSNSPKPGEHEAILEILRGFAEINKDLYKIAESRYAPSDTKLKKKLIVKRLKKG